jgi:hypothetical protein
MMIAGEGFRAWVVIASPDKAGRFTLIIGSGGTNRSKRKKDLQIALEVA